MKQNIVIKADMWSENSRSKAMVLVAKAQGVSSAIISDGRDRLEVLGVNIDIASLVTSLRKELGYADIVEVKLVEDKPAVCTCNHSFAYCHYQHGHHSFAYCM